MLACEKCQKEHDGTYATGRFCSTACARSFSSMVKRDETNKIVSEKMKGKKFPRRTKLCSKCQLLKVPQDFRKGSSWCRACRNLKSLSRNMYRYHTDLEYRKLRTESLVHYRRTLKYGITKDQYFAMVKAQNNVCKICGGVNADGKSLCVDHCHTTNKIRGLLCKSCNSGLGHFRDNTEFLDKAKQYLLEASIA